jgi:polyisoprenoid-binding protein YceI
MKKMRIGLLMALALALGCGQKPLASVGRLSLDPAASNLKAVALKNESKEVALSFPGLKGWAQADGQAELSIPVSALSTGDTARDANLKELFFELAKDAGFGQASFKLSKVDADLKGLASGQSAQAKGEGSLSLHGNSVALSGPLSFSRQGGTVTVVLGEGWQVLIDQTNFVEPLKTLNQHCPQPHRVGNVVKIQGTLVFKA